jgi:hypothetical protein
MDDPAMRRPCLFKERDVTSATKATSSAPFDFSHIGPDTPLRLDRAAEVAFPGGGMTASGLRREANKGRLTIEFIAGKQFTTIRAIEQMREKCRVQQKGLDFGSNPKSETATEALSAARGGSSVTDRVNSARAALEMTAKGLSGRSPSTLEQNTKSAASAAVIPLKSSS